MASELAIQIAELRQLADNQQATPYSQTENRTSDTVVDAIREAADTIERLHEENQFLRRAIDGESERGDIIATRRRMLVDAIRRIAELERVLRLYQEQRDMGFIDLLSNTAEAAADVEKLKHYDARFPGGKRGMFHNPIDHE